MPAVMRIVDRSIPMPHRPLVQTDFLESGNGAASERFFGVLVVAHREQDRILLDGFTKEIEWTVAEPSASEADAGLSPGEALFLVTVIDGLFEKGDPRFFPKAVTEENGRIASCGEHGGGCELGGIEHGGEVRWSDP